MPSSVLDIVSDSYILEIFPIKIVGNPRPIRKGPIISPIEAHKRGVGQGDHLHRLLQDVGVVDGVVQSPGCDRVGRINRHDKVEPMIV